MNRREFKYTAIVLSYPCTTCGAESGKICTSVSTGKPTYDTHANRSNQASENAWKPYNA